MNGQHYTISRLTTIHTPKGVAIKFCYTVLNPIKSHWLMEYVYIKQVNTIYIPIGIEKSTLYTLDRIPYGVYNDNKSKTGVNEYGNQR